MLHRRSLLAGSAVTASSLLVRTTAESHLYSALADQRSVTGPDHGEVRASYLAYCPAPLPDSHSVPWLSWRNRTEWVEGYRAWTLTIRGLRTLGLTLHDLKTEFPCVVLNGKRVHWPHSSQF